MRKHDDGEVYLKIDEQQGGRELLRQLDRDGELLRQLVCDGKTSNLCHSCLTSSERMAVSTTGVNGSMGQWNVNETSGLPVFIVVAKSFVEGLRWPGNGPRASL